MKILCSLLLSAMILVGSTTYAQRGYQGNLTIAIMTELSDRYGEEQLYNLRMIKTKLQFVNYIRSKAKTCHNCPMLKEFAKGLSGPPILPKGIPPKPGEKQEECVEKSNYEKGSKNFGSNVLSYYEDNYYLTDEDEEEKNGNCGPLHCLQRWGCHIPCIGLCSKDPIRKKMIAERKKKEEEAEAEEEDINYDDYDYDEY